MTIKIKAGHFAGTSKVFSRENDSLAAILIGIAVAQANITVQAAVAATSLDLGDLDFTDNSTGTAVDPAALGAAVLPSGSITAADSLGAQLTGFNTALTAGQNALAVIVGTAALLGAVVGVETPTVAGTVAVAGTIPAQTKTLTGVNGTSAVDFVSGRTALLRRYGQVKAVAAYLNSVLVAVGLTPLSIDVTGVPAGALTALDDATAAAAGGVEALSKAEADAALTDIANKIATIAAHWDAALGAYDPAVRTVVAG
jgi:hypothetical protein